MKCSEPAELPAAPDGAPVGVYPAAGNSIGGVDTAPVSPGLTGAGSFAVLFDDPRLGVASARWLPLAQARDGAREIGDALAQCVGRPAELPEHEPVSLSELPQS